MKDDVRTACLALVTGGTKVSPAARSPRPTALGWKLESGAVPAADLDALRESVGGALAGGAAPLRHWIASAPLRALLAEYRAVRRQGARAAGPQRALRARRVTRPADCA